MTPQAALNAEAEFAEARPGTGPDAGTARVAELRRRYAGFDGPALLRPLLESEFHGHLAVVSSFGTESAVILAQVAEIDRQTPILFLDTGKLFGETLHYRDRLVARLGLRDVRTIAPDLSRIAAADPLGVLWLSDPNRCCAIRKVEPLLGALDSFAAWISGCKRYQGGTREGLPTFETDAGCRIKVNPLAGWSRAQIEQEFTTRELPRHPLEAQGYPSIGCVPCTGRVLSGEDPRAGRWRGRQKTECGIHLQTLAGRPDEAWSAASAVS